MDCKEWGKVFCQSCFPILGWCSSIENWESYQHARLSMFAHRFVHAVKFDEIKTETSACGTVLLTIRGLNVQAINLFETDSTVFPQQTKSCVLRYHCSSLPTWTQRMWQFFVRSPCSSDPHGCHWDRGIAIAIHPTEMSKVVLDRHTKASVRIPKQNHDPLVYTMAKTQAQLLARHGVSSYQLGNSLPLRKVWFH